MMSWSRRELDDPQWDSSNRRLAQRINPRYIRTGIVHVLQYLYQLFVVVVLVFEFERPATIEDAEQRQ